MHIKPIYILFNADDSPSTGGGSASDTGETVTLTKAEHTKLTESHVLLDERAQKITELEQALNKLETEKNKYKASFEGLEGSVRKSYLEQLPAEHKSVAQLIPTVEGLGEYVKLHASSAPAGTDSGKPGAGYRDYSSTKWDDLNYNEKEEVRTKRPDLWKRLYREKFGTNP